jgi:DNA-binding NtrC family response regulator
MSLLDLFGEEAPARRQNRGRLLVVDDERDVREGIETLLQMEGYDVATAENGTLALEQAKTTAFDLVLTDMRMPGLSGLETLMGLRQLHPNLRVIVVTGYASEETAARCRSEGAYGFITKPFDVKHLLRLIEKAVTQDPGPQPP